MQDRTSDNTGPITEAARRYGWRFVLCQPGKKDPHTPYGRHVYRDVDGAIEWVRQGGNIGLTGHNLAILDWDDDAGREAMFSAFGPLPLTVQTARGKHHTYIAPDATLPGSMRLPDGRLVGEVRRVPSEYVVCPPSTFQGGTYRCLVESIELAPLPVEWRRYLAAQPSHPSDGSTGEPFVVPERIDAGGDGRPGLSRHRVFFLWTRSWKAQGFSLAEILDVILLANANITHPPLDPGHLAREVERAYSKPDREEFTREAVAL